MARSKASGKRQIDSVDQLGGPEKAGASSKGRPAQR